MAKHNANKHVSKGQRISCKGLKARSTIIIAPVERVENAMRQAFLNIKIASDHTRTKTMGVVNHILNSAKHNSGNPRYGRGWTANVSAKTLKQLTEQGVFA